MNTQIPELAARTQASLRGLIPEGLVDDFTEQQRRMHDISLVCESCAAEFGPDHPAALGCFLALVREAWGEPGLAAVGFRGGKTWQIRDPDKEGLSGYRGSGHTEREALVVSIELASKRAHAAPRSVPT